jgi:hypothetical protein
MDLKDIVADIQSGDLHRQGPALREAGNVIQLLASEAVNALVASPSSSRLAVASEISRFGDVVVPLLDALMTEEHEADVKIFAGTLLLHFGSRSPVEYLLSALNRRDEPTLIIATALSKAGVQEAAGPIEEMLRALDLRSDVHTAAGLIADLKNLNIEMPPDLRAKIASEASGEYRTALLKQWED